MACERQPNNWLQAAFSNVVGAHILSQKCTGLQNLALQTDDFSAVAADGSRISKGDPSSVSMRTVSYTMLWLFSF
jgi:hypothetical protein